MTLRASMLLLPNVIASPPPGALDLVCFGVFVLIGAFLLLLSVAPVVGRCHDGHPLAPVHRFSGFVAPLFFLSIALVAALARSSSSLACGAQGIALAIVLAMLDAAMSGRRKHLMTYFSRSRLVVLAVMVVALWALAFVFMAWSPHSVSRWLERAQLMSPLFSVGAALLWVWLTISRKGTSRAVENASRHEGIWRHSESGFALEQREETVRVEASTGARKDEKLRVDEPCVVFAPPRDDAGPFRGSGPLVASRVVAGNWEEHRASRDDAGPFRGSGPLVASRVVAGSWEEYRASLNESLHSLHVVAVCVLCALSFSAVELLLRVLLVLP